MTLNLHRLSRASTARKQGAKPAHPIANSGDSQELLFWIASGQNPVPSQWKRALVTGCGATTWCRLLAFNHPEIEITQYHCKKYAEPETPNHHVVVGKVPYALPFADEAFDYTRLMFSCLPSITWPHVLEELLRVTRNGGWVECVETSHAYSLAGPQTSLLKNWSEALSTMHGFVPQFGQTYQSPAYTATLDAPLGWQGGQLSPWLAEGIIEVHETNQAMYERDLGIDGERFYRILTLVRNEWATRETTIPLFLAAIQRSENTAFSWLQREQKRDGKRANRGKTAHKK